MKKAISLFLSLGVVAAFAAVVHADLQRPNSSSIRVVFDFASGRGGKYRIDAVNNQFIFGSSQPISGAVLVSSGTTVVLSTTATPTQRVFDVMNNAAATLFRVLQNGSVQISSSVVVGGDISAVGGNFSGNVTTGGMFIGSGAGITGLAGANATNTWTQPQYFTAGIHSSSGAASNILVGDGTVANRGSVTVAANSTATVAGLLDITGSVIGNVHSSTQGFRGEITFGTTLLDCVSTVTLRGSRFTVHATASHAIGVATIIAGYLVDGACPTGHVCTNNFSTAVTPCNTVGNGVETLACGMNALEVLPYGDHTFCFYSANNNAASTARSFLDFWVEGN